MYLSDPGLPTIKDLLQVYRRQVVTSSPGDPIVIPCSRMKDLLDEIERNWTEIARLKQEATDKPKGKK